MPVKIAHISDIHFFHFDLRPWQFFNKRFLGNFHYFFMRRKLHDAELAYRVLPFLQKQGVSHIIISGDYTCSSSAKEFQKMQDYIKTVKANGFEVFTLPGNHDAYTKSAHRNHSFFSYLGNQLPFSGHTSHNLIDHHVVAHQLSDLWWVVLINCSVPTSWTTSTGYFSPETEQSLLSLLDALPKNSEILCVCHFPFEPFKYPKAHLQRGECLEQIVKNDTRIRFYLHGHRHIPRIEQVGSLVIADSGSISLKTASACNILHIEHHDCTLQQYQYIDQDWRLTQNVTT